MPAAHAATTSTTAFMERLEQSESLGRAAEEMAKPMGSLLGEGPVSDALRGRPLGHALHPVLVQVPIGAVLSAAVLDVVQGRKAQAQSRLLMGAGLGHVGAGGPQRLGGVGARRRTHPTGRHRPRGPQRHRGGGLGAVVPDPAAGLVAGGRGVDRGGCGGVECRRSAGRAHEPGAQVRLARPAVGFRGCHQGQVRRLAPAPLALQRCEPRVRGQSPHHPIVPGDPLNGPLTVGVIQPP
ncbi:protein of unknown function [Micropruina glycogenica]|uniref:Uncharacterized protein n=1 Tax=Micropruina glycogenica TaxID=75385 RepID=A0A2N9JAW6_9ACTN|nr:protein of unknown function [Micropruina glycogenica]